MYRISGSAVRPAPRSPNGTQLSKIFFGSDNEVYRPSEFVRGCARNGRRKITEPASPTIIKALLLPVGSEGGRDSGLQAGVISHGNELRNCLSQTRVNSSKGSGHTTSAPTLPSFALSTLG